MTRLLYHFCLQPASRMVRVVLQEKGLGFELRDEGREDESGGLVTLSSDGEVPVLVEPDGTAYADAVAVCEYLDEAYPDPPLLPRGLSGRAEVRRLVGCFAGRLALEAVEPLLEEKLMKRLTRRGVPDSEAIRGALGALKPHLDYIAWLVDRRRWLAGDDFSLADIAAAAQLSALDYIGAVPWAAHSGAKDWYARVKSRPSLRAILLDHVAGAPPAAQYADLDF
jgi:glutathione S-transferase